MKNKFIPLFYLYKLTETEMMLDKAKVSLT